MINLTKDQLLQVMQGSQFDGWCDGLMVMLDGTEEGPVDAWSRSEAKRVYERLCEFGNYDQAIEARKQIDIKNGRNHERRSGNQRQSAPEI